MLNTMIDRTEDHRNLLEDPRRRPAQITPAPCPPRWWRSGGNRGTTAVVGRWRPVAVALAGLALVGLSATALTSILRVEEISHAPADVVAAAASQLAEVTTAEVVYEPGHSSGWHVHPGVHSVVVLSGTLTVYDEACRRHDYGPGQTYLGGREPHLARNTGTEAVGLAVTYVADPSARIPGSAVATPSGCAAA